MATVKEESLSPEELSFAEYADSTLPDIAPKKKTLKESMKEVYEKRKSNVNAAIKGGIEGMVNFGKMLGPTSDRNAKIEAYQKGVDYKDPELALASSLEEKFPTIDDFESKVLRRGVRNAPALAAGGMNASNVLTRSALSGATGQGLEEAGFGPIVQAIGEGVASIAPDLGRAIPNLRGGGQAARESNDIIDFGRRMGMNEEQIGLSLPKNGSGSNFLTDIAAKGGRTQRAFRQARDSLGQVWDDLRSNPAAQQQLNPRQQTQLFNNLGNRIRQLPHEQRARAQQDFMDFYNSPRRGEDIINLWQDLNYYIHRGERGLGTIKEDLQTALNQISPEFGREFNTLNRAYGNFSQLGERMAPGQMEQLIRTGEVGALISGITTGNESLLKKVLGAVTGRLVGRELLINPRFQHLGTRMVNAIEQGSPAVAQKVYNEMRREMEKTNKEAADKMTDFDFDEYFQSLEKDKSSNSKKDKK